MVDFGVFCVRTLPVIMCLCLHMLMVKAQTPSCSSRCDSPYDGGNDCQCNAACSRFGDCCHDYQTACIRGSSSGGGIQPIVPGDISRLARDLWTADTHRVSGWQYTLNKQARLRHPHMHRDRSHRRLFAYLEPSALNGPTLTPFRALLNNYARATGVAEQSTTLEQREIEAFMAAIMNTAVMTTTYEFLFRKGYVSSRHQFRDYLKRTWFDLFSRSGGTLDSSAFEHIFVGEIKNGAVTGFHNWIQFFIQETAGNLNYYGYTRESQPHQLLVQFSWGGQLKTLSSMMVGVSPEFELALYTVCFIAKPGQPCSFTLNGQRVSIRTWTMADKLTSAYFYIN